MFAAAILSACSGGDGGGEALAVSCANIKTLKSYRYAINVKLLISSQSPTATSTPAHLSVFADDLSALLSDFAIDGAYVAPDRKTAILRFQHDEVELRAIADRTWQRLGDKWQEQQKPAADVTPLTPNVVCSDTVQGLAPTFAGVEPRDDMTNGIETKHYHLDQADIVLRTGAQLTVPGNHQVDLWLAKEGRWPVRLEITAAATHERFFMEFRDINDAGITIEPPTAPSRPAS